MQVGLIGCGNMASAMARGWGRPVLCADLVVLCHKPAQLDVVAAEVAPHARAVASILGAVGLDRLHAAYPDAPVYRFLPSTPVELREGVVVQGADAPQDPAMDAAVADRFAELGLRVVVADGLVDVAMGLMSCAPAYVALLVEAQVDAGVRHGLPADKAAEMVVQTFAGTAALLRAKGYDTLRVRREVTSPGGITARGLDALERGGVRSAFMDAMDVVAGPAR